MKDFNVEYWDNLFLNKKTGWDIGYAAPAITEYFDQIKDKNVKILIPGAGNAYEAEYLNNNGLKNTYVLDFSTEAIKSFKKRCPNFPDERIIIQDFFEHTNKYDYIIELAFFTSFTPENRNKLVQKLSKLLNEKGKYVGLLFTHEFEKPYPPFGATKQIYDDLFLKYFNYKTFEIAYNSIKPRKNREYFIILEQK
ncbi:MAG: methyltransferase domain-containing protein [Bacteroidales bacterium]|nr:methyltransferase domain-containing protein [Bacteroidales bacterium]